MKAPPILATELRLDTSAVPKASTLAAVSSNAARATPYRPRKVLVVDVAIILLRSCLSLVIQQDTARCVGYGTGKLLCFRRKQCSLPPYLSQSENNDTTHFLASLPPCAERATSGENELIIALSWCWVFPGFSCRSSSSLKMIIADDDCIISGHLSVIHAFWIRPWRNHRRCRISGEADTLS